MMKVAGSRRRVLVRAWMFQSSFAVALVLSGLAGERSAAANEEGGHLQPGNLLVSRVVYDNDANNVKAGVTLLPPNCIAPACVAATDSGAYPNVWNNVLVDGSFGITAKIVLDQLKPSGTLVNSLEVPNSAQHDVPPNRNQMVGSFSSKSEVALNLSTDGRVVTFMGYLAPIDAIDISNSNTPLVVDPTNPVTATNYRVVAQLDQDGEFQFTKTNAYSGNNGRAAILNDKHGEHVLYTAGNAGNGADPQPAGVIIGAGAQIMTAETRPLATQNAGLPTPVGSFSIAQLGLAADKVGKDTNFRGLTVFDNVVYYTKGSGGNGINTVYFVDTSGFDSSNRPLACPQGVGVPAPFARLPSLPIVYDGPVLQTKGVVPYNMCILKGFPTATKSKTSFPFGIWFANAKTLYVADEGNGTNTYSTSTGRYTAATGQTSAGLQKWVFDDSLGAWKLAYVLQAGLDLGSPYTVSGYPTGQNPRTGLPWSPATDGLRNLTGRVNSDGTATIWAITSTVSGNGDQGADPNKLVMITDGLAATSLPSGESFSTVRTARFGEVLRGVSFTPGTNFARREAADETSGSCSMHQGAGGRDNACDGNAN
jgi:hypothetical protein